jgi:uncharacterized protein YjbI with pentapeptide repeats
MANPEHLDLLQQGVDIWNAWRVETPSIRPDLTEADLRGADLRKANLSEANLSKTNLVEAHLRSTNLHGANRIQADLFQADLREADLIGADLGVANLLRADLSGRMSVEPTFAGRYWLKRICQTSLFPAAEYMGYRRGT